MSRIIESLKIHHWPDSFAHSFGDMDMLGGPAGVWHLKTVGEIRKSKGYDYLLPLTARRQDGMEGSTIVISSKEVLQKLSELLTEKCVNLDWESIGKMEINL